MKKHLTVIVLCLVVSNALAQSSFSFNSLAEAEKIDYKIENKSKNDLYALTIEWINKYYSHPDLVLKENVHNERIKIEGSIYKAFDKELQDYYLDLTNYQAYYTLFIEFHENGYEIQYIHNKFTFNSDPSDLLLTDIINKPYQYKKDWRINYEYRVERLLNSLKHYITENELIYK